MNKQPSFSIIIVSLNGGPVIGRALDSLRADTYPDFEVIVVDNGSTDNLAEIVQTRYPEVRLLHSPVNLGFAGGNNLGLKEAKGDILVLLNDDTEVRPGWLHAWAKAAQENPDCGVMGCKLLYPDGKTIQHAGGMLRANGTTYHLGYEQEDDGRFEEAVKCDYVTGAAIAFTREAMEKLGPLDDKYFPIYFEETDYCWQARHIGYDVLYIPGSVVIHHESRTQERYSFRFLYRYHRCRFRFLAKCYSKKDLWYALKEELRWLWEPKDKGFYLPYLKACLAALFDLPKHLRDRFPFHRRMRRLSEIRRAEFRNKA